MNEDFVAFETAKKLKEKGFDWETSNVYERNTLACRYEDYPKPTIPQVLKWLREKHIDVIIMCNYTKDDEKFYYPQIWWHGIDKSPTDHYYDIYEQAATAGIEYVLDNLI